MRLRYCLREIAVAFVSHDDRGACLRDQKVRARDADVGIEELLSQLLSRFVEQFARFFQRAIRISRSTCVSRQKLPRLHVSRHERPAR